MRLRKLEIVVIGLTLAFACFMGGFFTGRSWNSVSVVAVATQNNEMNSADVSAVTTVSPATPVPEYGSEPSSGITSNPGASSDSGEIPNIPPVSGEATQPSETIRTPVVGDGKININIASQSELTDLPGIGNVLASRIVDYRRQHGDFSRIEDIRNVSGIGEKRYEAIQHLITVG